ncbi:uncharacterized protein LOC126179832 [Schistocerca cancellata]|uniref:uncharacterized protein LOC126179832 n=1 Tax=Schistocerca cancellata TaxID=274614 RepID=UPI0021172EBD|nr:uncharacterized protein LOC126179832 [Schistocerca cancellata]
MGCLLSCFDYMRECWRSLWSTDFTDDANAWLEFLGEEPFGSLDTVEIELSDITGTGVRSPDTVPTVAAEVPEAAAAGAAAVVEPAENARPLPDDYFLRLPEALARKILSMLDDATLLRASMASEEWGDLCRWQPELRVRVERQILREVPSETEQGVNILWRQVLRGCRCASHLLYTLALPVGSPLAIQLRKRSTR